ncbi:AarF/ABC1/UbiB kinase family protein [Candidatus Woesearchaeota archaeon]|nr:AarF/ABC1/UbiB kinase family protein [Candidatus Woesearchaeota archaeon]
MNFWLDKQESARLGKIAKVLFNNNLGNVLSNLRIRSKLKFSEQFKTERFKYQPMTPKLLLKIFEDLDGSFIKLGQLLSIRPDLIPEEYCEELSKLQDHVRPFSSVTAKKIIEKELGKPVKKLFKEFEDEPIASASMGQVHKAKLKDGSVVIIKVQRPNIERTIKTDIKLLYRLAKIVKKKYGTTHFEPIQVIREFETYTENELNYLKEAHNIDRFCSIFKDSKTIKIPKVFWSHTTSKVITMEYIAGRSLTSMKKIPAVTRKRIVNDIMQAQVEQMFLHGIFHADPHPGNFIIKRDGKVGIIDFGIVGRMDDVMRENTSNMFISLINADVDGVIDACVHMGVVGYGADITKLREDVIENFASFHNIDVSKLRLSKVLSTMIKAFKQNNLRIPTSLVLMLKAVVTLEGMVHSIYPDFNMVTKYKPFARKLALKRLNPKKIAERAINKTEKMMDFAESLPLKTDKFIRELDNTDRDLRRIDKDLNVLAVEIDRSSNRITLGFLAGTLFIASTILLPFQTFKLWGIPLLSFIGYMVALTVLITIFISILKEKKI